jgi:hypothetical protein
VTAAGQAQQPGHRMHALLALAGIRQICAFSSPGHTAAYQLTQRARLQHAYRRAETLVALAPRIPAAHQPGTMPQALASMAECRVRRNRRQVVRLRSGRAGSAAIPVPAALPRRRACPASPAGLSAAAWRAAGPGRPVPHSRPSPALVWVLAPQHRDLPARASSSASFDADERASSAIQLVGRTNVR